MLYNRLKKYFEHTHCDIADIMGMGISLLLLFIFILNQPLQIMSVPHADMILISFFRFASPEHYMQFFYGTVFVAIGALLILTMFFIQGRLWPLMIMIVSVMIGYIAMVSSSLASVSFIVAVGVLWVGMLLFRQDLKPFIMQISLYVIMGIAAFLMPHLALSLVSLFLMLSVYDIKINKVSLAYASSILFITLCCIIVGIAASVFMLEFDMQSLFMADRYIHSMIVSVGLCALYYVLRYMMHVPIPEFAQYASMTAPIIIVSILSGHFIGTLT